MYSTLTTAQLTTLRDAYHLVATGAATTIKEHTALGVGVKRVSPLEALEALRLIDEALAERLNPMGEFLNVDFDDPD